MQQAIDIAENMLSKYTDNISGDNFQYDSGYCNALEQILADLRALGDGWITVTERLPNEDCVVQIHCVHGIFTAWYTRHYGKFFYLGAVVIPTHWMPLPLPPKQ